jgi:hypothetical protein
MAKVSRGFKMLHCFLQARVWQQILKALSLLGNNLFYLAETILVIEEIGKLKISCVIQHTFIYPFAVLV